MPRANHMTNHMTNHMIYQHHVAMEVFVKFERPTVGFADFGAKKYISTMYMT